MMMHDLIEGFRLSPQQRRLWELRPDDPAYGAQCAVRLEGDVDAARLLAALGRVAGRHEILRTTFRRRPGLKTALQVVGDSAAVDWRETKLEEGGEGLDALAAAALLRERGSPFDLREGPPLRARLLRLGAARALLVISLPALCADSRTLDNLLGEVAADYAAGGHDAEASEEVVQYAQYSEWQNELLDSPEAAAARPAEDFSPDACDVRLPFERQAAAGDVFSPRAHRTHVAAETLALVEAACRARGADVRSFLLACWNVLLQRYAGEDGLVFGAACHGRTEEDLEGVLGPFTKYLPVACGPSARVPFAEVLRGVAESLRSADAAQDEFGWEHFVGSDERLAGLGFLPLSFDYYEGARGFSAAGVEFVPAARYACAERFSLKLSALRRGDSLALELHYDAARFEASDVERLASQLLVLLESAATRPRAAAGSLEILDDAERRRLLFDFNQTGEGGREDVCVQRLFEEQAALAPDAVAVEFEGRRLTYGELNLRANRLAHRLRALGVGAESRVGICLERSEQVLVAMLGVLKSGGAYVPLDPAHPDERLAALAGQARVAALVTQQGVAARLPSDTPSVRLDDPAESLERERGDDPAAVAVPANTAYVLFTSGSTGQPKGVCVEHRQLVNYTLAALERLGLPRGASYATVSTFAADLGNTSIFPALCGGGRLHVIAQERASDPKALAEYFDEHAVDCLKIVPSHLSALLTSERAERLMPRRRLVLGGEAAGRDLIERLRAASSETTILNHYGPTETTVGVLTYRLEAAAGEPVPAPLPLGRPLANTRVYLLDEQMRPVPFWASGELYVGGGNVARGYFDRPGATAEKFVPDPFASSPGQRLYRTGDVGRRTPNGDIEFQGRRDHQVKVRGFRVELGEVEAALRDHGGVREAVAVLREEASGETRLVAYVVAAGGVEVTGGVLREHLRGRLPEYMVPSAFVVLDRLPLTPNGKVDRKALPEPDHARAESAGGYVAPRTPVEEVLAGIWVAVLGTDRVGVNDNFFELGGHSLLATQVVSRVREALGVEVPLRALFELPTVKGLGERVEAALRSGSASAAPPVVRVSREGALPLSFAQRRLWFLDQLEPGNTSYNVPAAVRLSGRLDVRALERTLTEIVRRHEVLRTVFAASGGEPVQVIQPPAPVKLEVIDLSSLGDEERESESRRLATQEAQRPFDLARGPLLRAGLLKLGEEEHVALFTLHHIVSDGWSMGVLVREVAALYDAFTKGAASPLPELEIQYADYASWQRGWLQGEVLEEQLEYWRKQLEGAPAVIELPTDRPRPAAQTYRGASLPFAVPAAVAASLRELSRGEGATLFMTLLAAFQTLLARYTGQEDVCVGTPIANRHRVETEGLIGFFVNTLVLRGRVGGGMTFRELLQQAREATLGAYAHQDVPFERLVEELQPERDSNHTPLFQVMFSLQNTPREELELPGLKLSPYALGSKAAKFDLGMSLWDEGGNLGGYLDYSVALFDEESMAGLLERWQNLLAGVAAEPARPLSDIRLLGEERLGGYAPEDFPDAGLSQEDLENLFAEMSGA